MSQGFIEMSAEGGWSMPDEVPSLSFFFKVEHMHLTLTRLPRKLNPALFALWAKSKTTDLP